MLDVTEMGEKDRLFFSWTQKDRLATGRKVGIDLEGLGPTLSIGIRRLIFFLLD